MKIKRREFLGSTLAGAAGLLISGKIIRGEPAAANVDPTALVPLGKDLKVCRLSCGTGMHGGNRQTNQTRMGREKFEALLQYSYDQGVRLFDMADLYGTHPYVGRVLKDKPRDSFQLATKIWVRPGGIPEKERPDADVCVKRFLQELQQDYIDLVQIHCMDTPDWPTKWRKQMDIMEDLKQKGVIRAHGVTCHSLSALEAAAEEPWVDVVHTRINPYGANMDDKPEKVVPVLQKIHAAGKGIIGMKLIGEGKFNAEQRKRSVEWVLGLGCVDVLTVGFEKTPEIDELKANVRDWLGARAR